MLVLESADAAAPAPAAPAPAAAPAAASVVEVNVPDIGSDEVNVTDIMVKVGDTVEVDQSIINVEGDKASMEVPAPVAGVVKEILINVGDKVVTGKLIMKFEVAVQHQPQCQFNRLQHLQQHQQLQPLKK